MRASGTVCQVADRLRKLGTVMLKDLFDGKVAEALEQLPQEFRDKMQNVEVLVKDFAYPETIRSVGVESKWDLLGLYVGIPLTEQSFFMVGLLPERIFLYRRPIMRAAGGTHNLSIAIKEVVVHELGHHFGFDDGQLEAMTEIDD